MADPVLQIRGNGGRGGVRSLKKIFLALWASDLPKNKCVCVGGGGVASPGSATSKVLSNREL